MGPPGTWARGPASNALCQGCSSAPTVCLWWHRHSCRCHLRMGDRSSLWRIPMTPRRTIARLLFALCSLAAPTLADEPMPRTVNTSGESVVYVRPDEAMVGFGIESFGDTLDKSKQQNDEASAKLLKAIKALGVEDKHVQTDTVQVEIRYKEGNHPTLGIEG